MFTPQSAHLDAQHVSTMAGVVQIQTQWCALPVQQANTSTQVDPMIAVKVSICLLASLVI